MIICSISLFADRVAVMDTGSITIFIFCLGMANSLECHKCLINEGDCSKAPVEVCRANQDACFTVIKKYHGLIADTAKQGCGSANDCRRYPMGTEGSLFRTMWCCSSNLCQPIHMAVNLNGSQNGLACQSCIGNPAECGLTSPSRQCYGSTDRCVQISQRFLPESSDDCPLQEKSLNPSSRDVEIAPSKICRCSTRLGETLLSLTKKSVANPTAIIEAFQRSPQDSPMGCSATRIVIRAVKSTLFRKGRF